MYISTEISIVKFEGATVSIRRLIPRRRRIVFKVYEHDNDFERTKDSTNNANERYLQIQKRLKSRHLYISKLRVEIN